MSDAYIDTSAAYNGDGTSPDQATSDGGVGAYNNVATFFANASTSGQTRGIMRRLNLGSSYVPSAQLSPTNDGTFDTPLILIGYPFSKSVSGLSITGLDPWSRTNGSKFSFATTDTDAGQSSNYDHFWESATITIHQPGSANDGLTRKVIFSKYDASNGMQIAFWPDLPEALTTSATFDLSLQTYDPGDISDITAWNSDTNARPFIDGSGLSDDVLDFNSDYQWGLANLRVKSSLGYYCIDRACGVRNICAEGGYGFHYIRYNGVRLINGWGNRDIYTDIQRYTLQLAYFGDEYIDVHENASYSSYLGSAYQNLRVVNSSFGKVVSGGTTIDIKSSAGTIFDSCEFYVSDFSYSSSVVTPVTFTNCKFAGTERRFLQHNYFWKTKSITSSDTSYWTAPPSGTDWELLVTPLASNPNPTEVTAIFRHPVSLAASTSKTVTVKINPHGWTTALDDSQIWLEVEYRDESSGEHTKTATSKGTGTTSFANDTWSSISVTFTPGQTEIVEAKLFLTEYESGAYIRVDVDS